MSKYTHFTKLQHLIFPNGGSISHVDKGTLIPGVISPTIPKMINRRIINCNFTVLCHASELRWDDSRKKAPCPLHRVCRKVVTPQAGVGFTNQVLTTVSHRVRSSTIF
jgi:hypothetical protein